MGYLVTCLFKLDLVDSVVGETPTDSLNPENQLREHAPEVYREFVLRVFEIPLW